MPKATFPDTVLIFAFSFINVAAKLANSSVSKVVKSLAADVVVAILESS